MIDRYQLYHTLSLYTILIGGLVAAIGTFGWNYYGRKVTELKGAVQKENLNQNFKKASDQLDTNTTKIISAIDKSQKEKIKSPVNKKHKQQKMETPEPSKTEINANNALIVTNNQSGGNNTVVQNNLSLPRPDVKHAPWTVKNEVVFAPVNSDRQLRPSIPATPFKEKYGIDSLYRNEVGIDYRNGVMLSEIGFRVSRKDVKVGYISFSGMMMYKSGINKEGDFMFQVSNPGNGKYTISIYTVEPINNIYEVVNYLLPPEAMPK